MKAHRAGKAAEDVLAGALDAFGIIYRRQVIVGESIYPGQKVKTDFLLDNLVPFPHGLALESKWQDIDGSMDEKFPYLVANIRAAYPMPVVVVVHGGGCRPGALRWLQGCVDGDRLVAVFRLEEFLSWALRIEKTPIPTGVVR